MDSLIPAGSPILGSLGTEFQNWGKCWDLLQTMREKDPKVPGEPGEGQPPAPAHLSPGSGFLMLLLAGTQEPEEGSSTIHQPEVSEAGAHMLVCRLWVGGQDVVGNSSPTRGVGVAFVCVPW